MNRVGMYLHIKSNCNCQSRRRKKLYTISKFQGLQLIVIMPRALDRIQLTNSEENILNSKGYEITQKLGEGAYAKVCSQCILFTDDESSVCI